MSALVTLVLMASCGARTPLDTGELTPVDRDASVGIACVPGTFSLIKASPAVVFVLDRSGSMGMEFSNGLTRWQVLTSALSATLPSVDSSMEIGALLFPSTSGGMQEMMTCDVSSSVTLAPAFGHVAALVSLMQSTTPGGETPTASAIDVAANAIASVRAATTARALVLATDGAPNCNGSLDPATCTCADPGGGCGRRMPDMCLDDARTEAQIAMYAARGLPTYVIGIQDAGDTQFDDVLDAMAEAGGRPQTGGADAFYPATSEADLEVALGAIRDQIGSCTYLTTSVPSAAGSITVTVGGQTVTYDPTGASGWSWANESNGEILFSSSACAELTTSMTPLANVTCQSPADASASDGS